jgi:acyl carrier protein
VPVGVPGELYIGGHGVASGYLNRPELTRERFVPDPFGRERGGRMYRTGDIVRWQPGGCLEYFGRNDQQVKMRGFRIELGEIEATLDTHPSVRQSVVMARADQPGESRLVAYVVPANGQLPSVEHLRTFVKQHLPLYMVPSVFVALQELPRTPNGKVDRRALPVADGAQPKLETAYLAPVTATEQRIAAIWRDILHVERVGLEDNFFDLGGTSLLAMRVHRRLETELDVELTIMDLFEYTTVSALARYLSRPSGATGMTDARLRGERRRELRAARAQALRATPGERS